jgi:hypothetical protein
VTPHIESITYEIIVDTEGPDRRLDLLHCNVRKYGAVFSIVAPGTERSGELRRKEDSP